MRTFIKAIGTILSVSSIMIGLTALFTIDNANDLTTLLTLVVIMVTGVVGGITILVIIYPELTDLSEFEENSTILNDYEREIEELREYNLVLIDRYITFKSIIKSSKIINVDNMEKYPHLYKLIYEEDLVGGVNSIKESSLEQIERLKEVYN